MTGPLQMGSSVLQSSEFLAGFGVLPKTRVCRNTSQRISERCTYIVSAEGANELLR